MSLGSMFFRFLSTLCDIAETAVEYEGVGRLSTWAKLTFGMRSKISQGDAQGNLAGLLN